MKKKIILVFLLLIFIWTFKPKATAEIMPDNPQNYYSFYRLDDSKRFNVIKGNTSDDIYDELSWDLLIADLPGFIEVGTLRFSGKIIGSLGEIDINAYAYFDKYDFASYEVYVKDELIYKVNNVNYMPDIALSKEVNLYSSIGYDVDNYYLEMNLIPEYIDFPKQPDTRIIEELCLELLEDGYPFMLAGTYLVNDGYSDKDIHFVTTPQTLLSYQDITEAVIAKDASDGDVEDVSIIETNYLPDEDVSLGEYDITLRISDKSGNIIIQEAIIDVVDATPPKLTVKPLRYEYWFKSHHLFILQAVTVEDESECTKEVIDDQYTPNYNIVGTHIVKVKVTDAYGNYDTCEIPITVFDEEPPIITITDNVNITTLDALTKEDIKQYIYVKDECYGEINNYSIEDLNGYLEHTNVAGEYKFKITATDESEQTGYGFLFIKVHDQEFPTIEFNEYTIITQKGYNLTREEILEVLKRTGQISSDNVTISTSYEFYDKESEGFNEEGSYYLKITDEEGKEYNNTIEVNEKEEADYTPITNEEENNNYKVYIIIGISILFIGIIGVLAFIVYKKRH